MEEKRTKRGKTQIFTIFFINESRLTGKFHYNQISQQERLCHGKFSNFTDKRCDLKHKYENESNGARNLVRHDL